MDSIGLALQELGIDLDAEMRRGAPELVSGHGAYVVRGNCDAEATLRIFNDAIEQACKDGLAAFRAAAEMSWAVDCEDGPHHVTGSHGHYTANPFYDPAVTRLTAVADPQARNGCGGVVLASQDRAPVLATSWLPAVLCARPPLL